MKAISLVGGIVLVLAGLVVHPVSGENSKWKLHVDLIDGSRIVGTPTNKALSVDIGFDRLAIPIERIRRADWLRDGQTVRIEMVNSDTISGKVIPEPVKMTTLFGDVTLSMNHFQAMEVLPSNPYGWLPTNKGVVAYYSFDRKAGVETQNVISERHHGKVDGATWTELGKRGGAMHFNGSSQIIIPHHGDLCPSKITVAAWLYPTGPRGNYAMILGKSQGGSWSGGYGFIYHSGDPKHVHFYINGYTDSVAKAEVPNDKWSQLVGVCDGQSVQIFLNGAEVERVPLNPTDATYGHLTPTPSAIRHTNTPLIIGCDTSGYFWTGKMDEVALYNRPLSAAEIKRLYEAARGMRGEA